MGEKTISYYMSRHIYFRSACFRLNMKNGSPIYWIYILGFRVQISEWLYAINSASRLTILDKSLKICVL